MVTITLQVPDELAQRLNAERERLPEILERALELLLADTSAPPLPIVPPAAAFSEMIEFLSSHPSPEQILSFKLSPRAQARLVELLEKNREAGLTETERAELDWYEYVHHIMARLKAQARPPAAS